MTLTIFRLTVNYGFEGNESWFFDSKKAAEDSFYYIDEKIAGCSYTIEEVDLHETPMAEWS
jgi:hypothetical protein